jgi:predicted MFS family arabinose efflux permease
MSLLHNVRSQTRPRLDIPGTLTASAGLFLLVYGFSHANTTSWGNTVTLLSLAAGVALMVVFVAIQRRVAHPLLPLRIVLDRNRGGSYLAVGISGIAMFGVFLFLTYYLQQNLEFTPIQTGLAFLPMTAAIMITATSSTTLLLPRVGPRFLVGSGMLLAAIGMVILTGLGETTSYAGHVLPALVIAGVGFGLIFAPSFSGATLGVAPQDAGVASATVNTMQQIGGSIGTAALSTFAATAAASYASSHQPSPGLAAQAAVHGYTTAFWWSAGIFLFGALVCGLLLRPGVAREIVPVGEPVLAH